MTRNISDVLRIMRLAIGRRNTNDPDSTDTVLLSYVNDFMSLTMSDEFRIFEQYGTMTFDIDGTTDGVYSYPSSDTSQDFVTIPSQAMISLKDPVGSSVSWLSIRVVYDPQEFYSFWGVNNEDILIAGTPTEVLFHGTELVFRTIPDDDYSVYIYGYKRVNEATDQTDALPFDYWLRFVAYGAAKQYAADYRLSAESMQNIQQNYQRERKLLLTRTHNHIKHKRAAPRF